MIWQTQQFTELCLSGQLIKTGIFCPVPVIIVTTQLVLGWSFVESESERILTSSESLTCFNMSILVENPLLLLTSVGSILPVYCQLRNYIVSVLSVCCQVIWQYTDNTLTTLTIHWHQTGCGQFHSDVSLLSFYRQLNQRCYSIVSLLSVYCQVKLCCQFKQVVNIL